MKSTEFRSDPSFRVGRGAQHRAAVQLGRADGAGRPAGAGQPRLAGVLVLPRARPQEGGRARRRAGHEGMEQRLLLVQDDRQTQASLTVSVDWNPLDYHVLRV